MPGENFDSISPPPPTPCILLSPFIVFLAIVGKYVMLFSFSLLCHETSKNHFTSSQIYAGKPMGIPCLFLPVTLLLPQQNKMAHACAVVLWQTRSGHHLLSEKGTKLSLSNHSLPFLLRRRRTCRASFIIECVVSVLE